MNKDGRKVIQFPARDFSRSNSGTPGKATLLDRLQEQGRTGACLPGGQSTAGAMRAFNCVSRTPDRNMVSVPTTITMFTCIELLREA